MWNDDLLQTITVMENIWFDFFEGLRQGDRFQTDAINKSTILNALKAFSNVSMCEMRTAGKGVWFNGFYICADCHFLEITTTIKTASRYLMYTSELYVTLQ